MKPSFLIQISWQDNINSLLERFSAINSSEITEMDKSKLFVWNFFIGVDFGWFEGPIKSVLHVEESDVVSFVNSQQFIFHT